MRDRVHAVVRLLSSALVVACTSRSVEIGADGTGADAASSGGSPTEASIGAEATSLSTTTSGGSPPPPDTTGGDTTGGLFIVTLDADTSFECSTTEQDCPPGEKCMPYANDGGTAWNATGCFPIARDPVGYGVMCQVEGRLSGIDDCDAGMMCWGVDREGLGHCVHFCTGTLDDPMCPNAEEYCPSAGEGGVLVCLPRCDPLTQDCPLEGQVCYPVGRAWGCAPDASGEAGGFGDPCEYVNGCDPLHVCLDAAAFTSCEGAIGCCAQLCSLLDDNADTSCVALDPGQRCEPWYAEGRAPPGYEHVGVCALP